MLLSEYLHEITETVGEVRTQMTAREWEDKWDATLENSQSALDKLTLRAMKKYREGKTAEKGFDEL